MFAAKAAGQGRAKEPKETHVDPQQDGRVYMSAKPGRKTVLYRASDQMQHLAGTDRNQVKAQRALGGSPE